MGDLRGMLKHGGGVRHPYDQAITNKHRFGSITTYNILSSPINSGMVTQC